jgi:hypothetical protein
MAPATDPYRAPQSDRGIMRGSAPPRPEDVLATYEGSGRGRETWHLSITAERLYFQAEETEECLALDRAGFVEGVNIGVLSSARVGLLLRGPTRRVVTLPRAALDHVRGWLGPESLKAYQARTLRAGWASSTILGLLFLLPVAGLGLPQAVQLSAGVLLILSGVLSRFAPNRGAFLLRGAGWLGLAAGFVLDVAEGGRTRWLLVLVALLLFSALRYLRFYGFFGGRFGEPAPVTDSQDMSEDSLG